MNKKSRLRLTSWLLAVVMAISIASPALAVDASVVSESTPAAVNESTPDNSVPESIPAQGNDVPTSTDPPEENQSAADSSSEPKSESRPESESIPDSTSAPDSESTPDSSSAPESESMSDSDSASGSESTPDSESTSSTESDSEAPAFTPLGIAEMFTHTEAQPGDTVELYVRLNRDDVAVTYQWQVLDASPGELESPEAIYSYGEGESTDYAFLLDGMTEEELLAINPDAVWPGIEMYYAKKGKQARQRTLSSEPIHIENGTPNYVLNPEAQDIEDTEIAWRGIDGATDSTYPHVVTGDEEDLSYRCVITVTDEAYLTEAAQTETQSGTAEAVMEEAAPESSAEAVPDASASDARGRVLAMDAPVEEAASEEILISDSMYVDIPVAPSEDAPAMFSAVTGSAQDVHLSEDNQWLMGLTQHMEYITAQAYQEYGGEAANNPYWTKISGGARADGSKYAPTSLVDNTQMEVLSAWYGKTVYVRVQGESGPGKAIEIPAYTGVDYQTGEKTLYKSAIKVINAYVPDTGMSFYNAFLRTALNDGWANNGCHITLDAIPIDNFNRVPTNYLTNAEGDYVYDLVIVGASAYSEPDISGAAAWALADYIGEGYGFLIGHDMMYGYAGVNPNPYYEPDPSDTTTPYYVQNSKENGHWNLNWLMGVNKLYTEASPYDAASMILNIGDFNDKSTMYGDDSGSSTLRIKKKLEGDPAANVTARCPTNWPYTAFADGTPFEKGVTFAGTATHTNQQMAFGTVWIDYASNSITDIGGGKLLETTVDGVYGTNNFYLTTNGNFGMSQIGHKSENINLAKLEECYLLANTVMYLSQRQQCQVCQSEQGGNREIHFVHRISSAEELQKLNDQDKYWFTHPIDDCYMLTLDITLPDDWEPIHGFRGHFDADGHDVTLGANKAPLFEQKGTDPAAWNLGEDKEHGTPTISADGARTTGIARVVGYLKDLFRDSDTNYAGWRVVVHGTDGKGYECVTNNEGKYVVSNLPCTGIMPASVYNTAGEEAEAGRVYTMSIDPGFWDTDVTRPLQLVAPGAQPVKDTSVYEAQTAVMAQGGAWLSNHVYTKDEVRWEYRDGDQWKPVSEDKFPGFSYTVEAGKKQDDFQFTRTELTLPNVLDEWDGLHFRAVFSYQGQTVTTADNGVAVNGYNGILTVRRKMVVTNPDDQTIWVNDNAVFTSSCEALYSPEKDKNFAGRQLSLVWQYRTSDAGEWKNVMDDVELKKSASVKTDVTSTGSAVTPWKSTTTLTLKNCPESYTGLQFRAVYSYVGGFGKTVAKNSAPANLTVRGPELSVRWITEQPGRDGMSDDNPLWLEQSTHTTQDGAAVYTAEVSYNPGAADLANGGQPPKLSGQWKYHTYEDQRLKVWNTNTVADAVKLAGAKMTPNVTFGDPVYVEDREGVHIYRVTMTISNIDEMFDAGQTRFYFSYHPTMVFSGETLTAATSDMPLCLDYIVNANFGPGVQNDANNDGVQDSDVCLIDTELGKQYSDWSFPNLTLRSGRSTFQSMILMYDDRAHIDDHYGAGNPDYDKDDKLMFRDGGDGLSAINAKITINNPHYMMITAKSNAGISVEAMESWLRANVQWRSYDPTAKPAKITVYVDVENNLASKTNAVSRFFRSLLGAAPVIDAPGTVQENGTITFTSNAGYPAQWQMSEDGGKTFVDMPGETQPYLVIDTALPMMQGWQYRVRNASGDTSAPVTLQISNDIMLLPVQAGASTEWAFEAQSGAVSQFGDASKQTITLRNAAVTTGTPGFYASAKITIPQEYVDANATVDITYHLDSIDSPGGNICISAVQPGDSDWAYNPDRDRLVSSANAGQTVTEHFTLSSQYVKNNEVALTMWNNGRIVNEWAQVTITQVKVNGVPMTPGGKPTLARTSHSGYDVADISACKELPLPGGGQLTITAINKIYDGTETVAKASIGSPVSPSVAQQLLARATIAYSSGSSTSGTASSGSGCIDAGKYTATVTLQAADAQKYGINQTASCTFQIAARPLHLYSYNNDRAYDGTDQGTIRNIQIKPFDDTAASGIVDRDKGKVTLSSASVSGGYKETIHQTAGQQIDMVRGGSLTLTGERAGNYRISTEDYTGAITPRGLTVHSLYQDPGDTGNNPRNVKVYDGTNEATITHILLDGAVEGDDVIVAQDSIAGTYESSNAGETLTPDGTAQENAENKLLEYKITRTGEISLDNNPYGDYEIKAEQYSGAIRRRTISAFVGNLTARYGDGLAEEPTAAAEYSAAEGGSGTQLQISALVADDTLTLDADKSGFEYAPITAETEAGYYPLEYVGLTEENYPVLRNYIIWYEPGSIAVTPRPLVISAGEYSMIYGDPLPEFAPAYNGFINGDTPDSDLQGEPVFVTDATSTSDVGCYPVELSGLTANPNANGAENYVVYLQPGTLDINRRPIIIEPDPDPDPDPAPVPELRRVKTEKEADREAAAVGDIITYKITVNNIGSVELKDIPVRDTNDGAGRITAADGPGYTWNEDSGTWTIHRLPVGKSITITYTYEVVEADDGKDITNVAVTTVPGTNPEDPDNPGHGIDPEKPIDPDAEYPSDEVIVPVDPDREPDPDPDPVDGRSITIVKFTDTAFAAVGDTIGYGATVTNNGTVDLTNIRLEDVFANASGPITPVEGDGYVWEDGDALIPELAVGESVTVYFDYTVQADDAGKNLRNVVIASVPGENPPDPDAPDTGVNDPDAPVTPDVEYPSNEVVVPVDPAGGGVAAEPKVKIYGDSDPELTYTLTEELIKPDDIWGELERVPGEAVGVYPILQGTLESKNYDITYVPAIFRILPAPLTVTVQDKTKVYGDANPTLTYTVTGFKFDETLESATDNNVTVETPATLESGAGEYAIQASGLTFPANDQGNSNYYAVYVDGTLRITPALLTVTAQDKTKVYGAPNPKLTYTVTGWKLDDTLENATNNDVQLDTPVGLYTLVGEYPITPSGLTLPLNAQGKVNYDVQYVPGVFRVLPITGLIDVFAPEAEAIVRGPDGNILTVTPKQFPKTGVTPSDVTEHEDGTLTAEFEGDSAPDEITYNGKTYSRTGEVTIDRADGAPKEPESVVVEYSGLEEQQVPQTYHVDNGSRSYDLSLSDVQFAAGAPQTLTIDYTDTATPTPPQVYVAEIDGVETTFTLASMEQTSDYSWRDVDFTTVWYGRQLADFYLGKIQPDSPAIPFDSANPRYAGYEAVLLQYLGLDADTYRIVDSEWRQLDEPWQNTLRHTGVYHAQRYAASWRATYTTASGTYDAVATYSALAEEAPAIATADYAEVRATPASVLPIVVLSCLGVLFLAAVVVATLMILRKRRQDDKPKT